MTSSGLNWQTLGFQQYETDPWNFWQSYEQYLRNAQFVPLFQWCVLFSGAPLVLSADSFSNLGVLRNEILGNYSVRVLAKKVFVNSLPAPEDIIEVYSGGGNTPNGVMQACDENLTPRIETVKQAVLTTLAKNEEARWQASQVAAQALADQATANSEAKAILQAEADRLAAINTRDSLTALRFAIAAAKTGAENTVKSFLNLYYPLPADWAYDIAETEGPSEYRLSAVARYYGRGASRPDVPAGYVALDPALYGGDAVTVWNLLASDFPTASTSKPVFILTVQRSRSEDSTANPGAQDDTVMLAPPMAELTDPIAITASVPQGVASDGLHPWDTQPDVMPPLPNPTVLGTHYGANYVPTGSEPEFLNWLNLYLPEPVKVAIILKDSELLSEYETIFQKELAKAYPEYKGNTYVPNLVDGLPKPSLFDEPLRVSYGEPEEGSGVLPRQEAQGSVFVQKDPSNLATVNVSSSGAATDYVGMMLAGNASDFLNMLAQQYSETLAKISVIPKAREDFDAYVDEKGYVQVELYLRTWDAAVYEVKVPGKKEETPPPVSEEPSKNGKWKMVLLGALLIVTAYFVSRNEKAQIAGA